MSMRSLIEINHDYLLDILDSPEKMKQLRIALSMGGGEHYPLPTGVKLLALRHHTEHFYLKPDDAKLFHSQGSSEGER